MTRRPDTSVSTLGTLLRGHAERVTFALEADINKFSDRIIVPRHELTLIRDCLAAASDSVDGQFIEMVGRISKAPPTVSIAAIATGRFVANAKEVLREGKHYADAHSEDAAKIIAGALNLSDAAVAKERARCAKIAKDHAEAIREVAASIASPNAKAMNLSAAFGIDAIAEVIEMGDPS